MVRIRNAHDAALHALRTGDTIPADRIHRRNRAIMGELFTRTQRGEIKGFYLLSDSDFKAYHRSTKEVGKIQLSSGFYKSGELFPTYDIQLGTVEEMEREHYSAGKWEVIL